MGPKPTHLTLNDEGERPRPPRLPFSLDLPSPRPGEIPPALSPLDAFAMSSRLLAKRFEQPNEEGRRLSRLPHMDVAKELAQRPGYFRSVSDESSRTDGAISPMPDLKEEPSPTNAESRGLVAAAPEKDRPVSHYPMFGNAGPARKENGRPLSTQMETPMETAMEDTPMEFFDAEEGAPKSPRQRDYFGMGVPRATSPEPVDPRMINVQAASPLTMPSLTNSVDSVQSSQHRTLTNGSTRSQRSLAPPKSPAYPKSPRSMQSIRSVLPDSGDEDGSVSGSQPLSSSRKFSGSSNMSRPHSPFSPVYPPHRSPSTMSDYSINGSQRRNFSRPLSGSGSRPDFDTRPSFESHSSFETRPSNDLPHRYPSAASTSTHPSSGMPSRQASQDDATTPSVNSTLRHYESVDGDEYRPMTSYTYSKYALPRGKNVERNSRGTRESWLQRQFTWDNEVDLELEQKQQRARTGSDGGVMLESQQQRSMESQQRSLEYPQGSLDYPQRSFDYSQQSLDLPQRPSDVWQRPGSSTASARLPHAEEREERKGRNRAMSNANRSRSADARTFHKANALHKSTASIRTHGTDSTDRTIKATPLHERSASAELTPEEHLDIGIETHSNGELNKSTYHLRLAAKEGLPTAMLLYALACRHGWGMRPNQEEGVMWLRKAIDSAGLEVADVEATLASSTASKGDPVAEAAERRKRKAQFALAIYELGISYMNGWGCQKDKPLAVNCYEVAGGWGDCDALAEAAYCYTQGLGVKKDMKKAAALYRKAADGGMSMAGNSWIYKPKYMDESSKTPEKDKNRVDTSLTTISKESTKDKDAKPAGRSRARSIWSRKKDKAAPA